MICLVKPLYAEANPGKPVIKCVKCPFHGKCELENEKCEREDEQK